jgi:hypothetical protein
MTVKVEPGCLIARVLWVEILPGLDLALASLDSGEQSGGKSRGRD